MTDRPRPIGPRTVTVLGSHWPASWAWDGLDFNRAKLRRHANDYHLAVPFCHLDDRARGRAAPDDWAISRVRPKRDVDRFERVNGVWMVVEGDRG